MWHARLGVVSAVRIISEAQTLLFPANAPVGQETWRKVALVAGDGLYSGRLY